MKAKERKQEADLDIKNISESVTKSPSTTSIARLTRRGVEAGGGGMTKAADTL